MTEKERNTGAFIYRMYLLHCKKSIGFVAIYSICTLVVLPPQPQAPLSTVYTGLESCPCPSQSPVGFLRLVLLRI